MSTPVLVAIILSAVGGAAALTRLRLADRRSVAAHHRALETMGRLVAQQPTGESAATPEPHAGQAHVRLVSGTEPVMTPYASPPSRRRDRGAQPPEYDSWEDVAPVAPAPVADAAENAPVPAPSPPVLHFEALPGAAPPGDEGPAPNPHARPAARHSGRARVAPSRVRRRRRGSRKALRRTAVGALIVVLMAAGTLGGVLISRDRPGPARAPAPAARAAPPTTPTTLKAAPAAPVLVNSGAGYSEYRLAGPATIVLTASGRCWVEIRQTGPRGPLLYEGDLVAGDTRGAPVSAWLRLGNPSNVTVRVNGVTISPPSLIAGEPYNLQFG